ncbi:MAG: TonB-dependent receptor [Pseudomonadota bacterium]
MGNSLRERLLATSLLAVMLGAAPAVAQDPERVTETEVEDEAVQETITVTGSRLNTNPNLIAASPVLSVGAEDIDVRGNVRIEDLINILPQVFAGQAGEVSNGATGTASLNLRGLGADRTLTLIDGRRLPFGSSTVSAANLDLVPTQLIERVDILTGGASAVYGSDAVAGVANFILKNDFEGVELDVQGGLAQAGNGVEPFDSANAVAGFPVPDSTVDGEELFVALTLGANTADGRGNVTLFGSYEIRNDIVQADRSVSACSLNADTGDLSVDGFACGGSVNFRLFGGDGGFAFQQEDGTINPATFGPEEQFNFGALNFFQRPSERFQIYTRGHYDLTENLEIFADLSFTNNSSDAQIAPTASFGIGAFSINCDNPLIQGASGPAGAGLNLATDTFGCTPEQIASGADVSGITASHRNVEGGNRNSNLDNTAWRLVGGLRGDFLDSVWSYEVFGQFSRTQDVSIASNDFVTANVQDAFFAVDDGSGNVVCRSGNAGCVPYNIFQRGPNGESLVSQGSLDFIQGVGITTGETQQIVAGATLQADLGNYGIKSPWTDAGIGFLFGLEAREDELEAIPDEISQIQGGGFTGVGGATLPVAGQSRVFEIFQEVQIPIVTERPFFEELTFSGQYRHSDYQVEGNDVENSFDTNAFGLQLTWAPISDIKFRGQFQRSVRAPNVIELFTGVNTDLPNLNPAGTNADGTQLFDPCASNAPLLSLEQCALTGVTFEQFGGPEGGSTTGGILDVIAGQTQSITSGNALLDPESSDTFTIGGIFTPAAVPGLSISIDYFDISVDDFITVVPAQNALDSCLNTGADFFCDLITRADSGTLAAGTFGVGFDQTNFNIAELNTSGIDFQILYSFDLASVGLNGVGDLQLDYASTYLAEYDFLPVEGAELIECAGAFGNTCPEFIPVAPEYRHRLVATWNTPWNLQISNTWRYNSGTDNNAASPAPVDTELATTNYWDIGANYSLNDNLAFRFGVLNLLDEVPPVSVSAGPPLGNGNTFPTIFDTGRFIFLGATLRL